MGERRIKNLEIEKSGKNKYAGFEYYELADITPAILQFCVENKLYTHTSFDNENATLTIINVEKPEEILIFTSPMRDLDLKGCNAIQNLGGVETYQRRYLYLMAFDIVEPDEFDNLVGAPIAPPTLDEVKEYLIEKQLTHFGANKFYTYYSNNGWKSKDGQQITNWKRVCEMWEQDGIEKEKETYRKMAEKANFGGQQ